MRYVVFLAQLFLLAGCASQSGEAYIFSYFTGNGEDGLHIAYSRDGLNWEAVNGGEPLLAPELSRDKLMRDPCIIRGGDGLFHMVWTVSWEEKGIGYASSSDLVNWSGQQMIPVLAEVEGVRNCWAPEITFDETSGEYMIYWASTIEGRFAETAEKEEGNLCHRIYAVTTKDFHTFSDAFLLYDYGFNVIDASIHYWSGRYVMFLKDETLIPPQKNIRIAYADRLTGPYSEPSAPITGDYWAEGPTFLDVDSTYYVYFDRYMEGRFGVVRSFDMKEWEDVSDRLKMPEGIRHGSALRITDEELKPLLDLERKE